VYVYVCVCVCVCVYVCVCMYVFAIPRGPCRCESDVTAIPIMIEGRFQVFQRFSSSKLVLKTVKSCFAALNYYGNSSMDA
jgi:hypothetical protein